MATLNIAQGLCFWPVTCSLLALRPPYAIPSPAGDKRRTTAGGFFWQTAGVTWALGLAPRGVRTLPPGPQLLLESGRQEGSDRLAGQPH